MKQNQKKKLSLSKTTVAKFNSNASGKIWGGEDTQTMPSGAKCFTNAVQSFFLGNCTPPPPPPPPPPAPIK